ncbi:MAG: hypothetical protein K5649_03780 [Lachnospiraceae bacterium]|nr:hypothetical protein [Lachnospiraceae bacterium]
MPKKDTPFTSAVTSAVTPTPISIRCYPASLCRERQSANGRSFQSVSFMFDGAWASFLLTDSDSIKPSTRMNGDPIPGRVDLVLGDPEDVRFCSIRNEEANTYERKALFNRTIKAAIDEDKQAFLRTIAI